MKFYENLRWWVPNGFSATSVYWIWIAIKATRKSGFPKTKRRKQNNCSLIRVLEWESRRWMQVGERFSFNPTPGLQFRRIDVSSRSKCEFTTFILWPISSVEHLTTSSFSLRCIKLQLPQNFEWRRVLCTCATPDTSDSTLTHSLYCRLSAASLLVFVFTYGRFGISKTLRPSEYFTAK